MDTEHLYTTLPVVFRAAIRYSLAPCGLGTQSTLARADSNRASYQCVVVPASQRGIGGVVILSPVERDMKLTATTAK